MMTTAIIVPLILSSVLGFITPLVSELLTKASASDLVKSTVTASIAILAGVIPTVPFTSNIWEYLGAILLAWLIAGRSYQTGIARPVTDSTRTFGLGKSDGASQP